MKHRADFKNKKKGNVCWTFFAFTNLLLRPTQNRWNCQPITSRYLHFPLIVLPNDSPCRIPYADKITPEPILHNNSNRDTKADSIRNSYNSQFKVGIYGWRKKCLYILVMALMLMMVINLALTLWVLKVLDFNSVRIYETSSFINIKRLLLFLCNCRFDKPEWNDEILFDVTNFNLVLDWPVRLVVRDPDC